MLNRRLASLLAAVSVAGLAVTGCAEQSAAIRVDDRTISRGDFEDQLDYVYDNEAFRSTLFGGVTSDQLRAEDDPPGSFRQEYVGALASINVQFMVVETMLADEGLEVSDDARASAIEQLGGQEATDDLPGDMADRFIDGFAGSTVLQEELDDAATAYRRAVDRSTIEVNPRYGSWDGDQLAVVPPEGPADGGGASAAGVSDLPGG